jgi:EAL domain-containing protein (putative c-di-GMP-specific phosphodiesterase class I)
LSSFSYLRNLPVNYLKIDGSFIRGLDTDPVNAAMVNAIVQLGKVMGIETIAEFVENDTTLQLLAEIGVDYVQGYGISRPRPLDAAVTEGLSEPDRRRQSPGPTVTERGFQQHGQADKQKGRERGYP